MKIIPCGGFSISEDFNFIGRILHLSESAKAWTKDHRKLENKDAHNQHPIHSITNLSESLETLQEEIDALSSSSDVIDIVDTHADLLTYDTQKLHNNDIVKVLEDENHDDAVSYYRWADNAWAYVGSQSPYFTKSEVEQMFSDIDPQLLPTLTEEEDNGKYAQFIEGEWTATHFEHGEIIHATNTTTVLGYSVPTFGESQMTAIYNSYIAGKNVIISSVDGNHHYHVISVDSSDADNITAKVLFEDKIILTYNKFGNVSSYVPILNGDGQIVALSREYGTSPNDHGYYREWSENVQGKVWVECGSLVTTTANLAGTTFTLPCTYEDTNYYLNVAVREQGNFHIYARPISNNTVNVRATDVGGNPMAVNISVEARGWMEQS